MEVPKLKLTIKLTNSASSSGKATPTPDLKVKLPSAPAVKKPAVAKRKLNDGFRPRPHRLVSVQVGTVNGYSFTVPAWACERTTNTRPTTTGAQEPSTFVCPHEGCHKIFDVKSKWRRHQATHNGNKA